MDAAIVVFDVDTNLDIAVTKDFKLTGHVLKIDVKVKEFIPFFYSHTTEKSLQAQLNFLSQAFKQYLNEMLDAGI